MINKIKKMLCEARALDKKSPPSTRLYNIISIAALSAAILLLAICICLFWAGIRFAAAFWCYSAYFAAALFVCGFFLGTKQRLRGGYLLSKISVFLMGVFALLFIIACIM